MDHNSLPIDLDSDLEELSLEDIENLLPQLSVALERAKVAEEESLNNKHISEVVQEKFVEVWKGVETEITDEFNNSLAKEREKFLLTEGLRVVMEKAIGKDKAKDFLNVAKECAKQRDFTPAKKFYQKVEGEDVSKAAQAGFAVYRFNLALRSNEIKEQKVVRKRILALKREECPLVETTFQDFEEIGLLPL